MLFPDDTTATFPCLSLDPPWNERGGGAVVRGAQKHYPLIKTAPAIEKVVRASGLWRPSVDAHCYLWVTNNFLPIGMELLARLGFTYKTNIAWHKLRAGLGQYFRGKHELMLFGIRGRGFKARTGRRDLPSSIKALEIVPDNDDVWEVESLEVDHVRDEDGRIVHSAKPVEFYDLIEARTLGPRVEFFARSLRQGWTSWGNEVDEVA